MERAIEGKFLEGEKSLASINMPQHDAKNVRNTNQLVFLRTVVMKAMMQHRHSLPFRKPVNVALLNLSDYHDIIKEPMDFGTIKSRLEENYYWSSQECIQDFKLVFSNCYSYNQPDEEIVANAKDLEEFFYAKIDAMPKSEMEVEDISAAKCSRETLGLQDYLSSYFAPSPGVEVRSRRATQRSSVGEISSKKSKKGKGRSTRRDKKMPAGVSQLKGGAADGNMVEFKLQAVVQNPAVLSSRLTGEDEEVDDLKGIEENIVVEQDDGEMIAKANVDSSPSLVTNMAHNWKDIEAGKAKQQSSANFRSRIEFTSRPFKNWAAEAGRPQKAKRGRLTEVSLPGMRVCALSGNLAGNKVDAGLVNRQEVEEFGDHKVDKKERDQKMADEEDLNITVGFEEERVRAAAKVQLWLEGM